MGGEYRGAEVGRGDAGERGSSVSVWIGIAGPIFRKAQSWTGRNPLHHARTKSKMSDDEEPPPLEHGLHENDPPPAPDLVRELEGGFRRVEVAIRGVHEEVERGRVERARDMTAVEGGR